MKYLFLKNYGLRCYTAVDKQQNYIKLKLKLKPLIGPNGFFPFFDQSGSIILFFIGSLRPIGLSTAVEQR